jgi:phosphatidate cytidylyltransferase
VLKTRLLTALVLIPLLLAALFWLPSVLVAVLFGAVIFLGALEWGMLSGFAGGRRLAYAVAVTAVGAFAVVPIVLLPTPRMPVMPLLASFGAVLLFWLLALAALVRNRPDSFLFHGVPGRALSGFFVLVPAWQATVLLHAHDGHAWPALLVFLFLLVWGADSFAYFAGHIFGRHKLAPAVSPGKTIEGVVGGMLAVLLLAVLAGLFLWKTDGVRWLWWLLLCLAVGLISVLGDLVESKMKRVAGVKDSGTIVPGHGGVLDRIDALTAAAPAFAFGTLLLQLVRT